MLVLSRKVDEKIMIGGDIVVTVLRSFGGKVRIGIEAPANVRVLRAELMGKPPSLPAKIPDGETDVQKTFAQ